MTNQHKNTFDCSLIGLALLLAGNAVHGQCDPTWSPLGEGISSSTVFDMAVFDDGSGPALYVGGDFFKAGEIYTDYIAKWDGTSWSRLGNGTGELEDYVYALEVFDDGAGPALYVAGDFDSTGSVIASRIAKWDGSVWSRVGDGIIGGVSSLCVFDDGSGAALYAGGYITMAGGIEVNHIAKWDGSTWSRLANGLSRSVSAMAVFDDGTGDALYVGGFFDTAGGVFANSIARWDGAQWSRLSTGLKNAGISSLTVYDDGTGPALYVGGDFKDAGGAANVNGIAKWNGFFWASLGTGLAAGGNYTGARELTVFDDGSGPALYVAGNFTFAGGVAASNIAKWNGSSWASLGTGLNGVAEAITLFNDGTGSALYVGGRFFTAGGVPANRMARWAEPVPIIARQPANQTVRKGGQTTQFSIETVSGAGPMEYQWRKDGQPLAEDPPRIIGTKTTTLTIDPVLQVDDGTYDALITNQCGQVISAGAQLDVWCYADCDTSTGSGVLDIFDFLCFQSLFVNLNPVADCDGDNLLNIFDFLCFQDAFVAECP